MCECASMKMCGWEKNRDLLRFYKLKMSISSGIEVPVR